jgi:Protein of unknown function (DUF2695)
MISAFPSTAASVHKGEQTMTKQIDWREFFDRLDGHFAEDGRCSAKMDRTFSRKILASMGVSAHQIEECMALFEEHGGFCDCEVVMNARDRICPETLGEDEQKELEKWFELGAKWRQLHETVFERHEDFVAQKKALQRETEALEGKPRPPGSWEEGEPPVH